MDDLKDKIAVVVEDKTIYLLPCRISHWVNKKVTLVDEIASGKIFQQQIPLNKYIVPKRGHYLTIPQIYLYIRGSLSTSNADRVICNENLGLISVIPEDHELDTRLRQRLSFKLI